jgi:hypothetical protein
MKQAGLWIHMDSHKFEWLDPDPGGQKLPTNIEKSKEFSSAGCSLLRTEGFSCSLCVLYGGLRISKLQFSIKKILNIYRCNFFQFLVIKTLDSDWIRIRFRNYEKCWIRVRIRISVADPDPGKVKNQKVFNLP